MHMVKGYIEKNYLAPTSVPQPPSSSFLVCISFQSYCISYRFMCVCVCTHHCLSEIQIYLSTLYFNWQSYSWRHYF